jgi:hypothetical protein
MNKILGNAYLEAREKRKSQPFNLANARYPKKSKFGTMADLASDASDDDDDSRCVFCDGLPLPASRPVLKCAGDGCSVWAHLDCVRRHLSGGGRLPRHAYCETCLTQNPELADPVHICLNPSDERAQTYAAEQANRSDDDASPRLSSLPADLSSNRVVIDTFFGGLEDDAVKQSDSDDESYVPSEPDGSSDIHSASQCATRFSGDATLQLGAVPSLQFDHAGNCWQASGQHADSAAANAQGTNSAAPAEVSPADHPIRDAATRPLHSPYSLFPDAAHAACSRGSSCTCAGLDGAAGSRLGASESAEVPNA